jgi:predicted PurR-regulated permease PerM
VIAERVGLYVKESAVGFLRRHAESFFAAGTAASSAAAAVFSSIWRWVVGVLFFVGNVAVFCFVAGYLLKDFHRIVAATRELIPSKWRPRVVEIVGKIDVQVHSFLRGQLLVCLILSVLYGIGFGISGVPFAIPIAVIGGLASFIPYVGATVAVVPAVLLALLEHGAAWNVLGVLVTFVAAQSLEGYVLTPNIVGHQVGLSPLWVILSLMVFATLLGFPGLLLAVPVAAALKVLVVEALTYYRRSALFEPGAAGEDAGASEET